MLKRILLGAALVSAPLLMPAAAHAQSSQQTRSANAPIGGLLTIFGDDKCPADTICVTAPESDRYRIPKDLRQPIGRPQQSESQAVRMEGMVQSNNAGTGSCSTVGVGGGTGCFVRQATAAKAETRARKKAAEDLPLP